MPLRQTPERIKVIAPVILVVTTVFDVVDVAGERQGGVVTRNIFTCGGFQRGELVCQERTHFPGLRIISKTLRRQICGHIQCDGRDHAAVPPRELGFRFQGAEQLEEDADFFVGRSPRFGKVFFHELVGNGQFAVGETCHESVDKRSVIVECSGGKQFPAHRVHPGEECRGGQGAFAGELEFPADSFRPFFLGSPEIIATGATEDRNGEFAGQKRPKTTSEQHDCSGFGEEGSGRKGVDKRPHARQPLTRINIVHMF